MSSKNKVLVLGIDGMDPMITKKYLEKGVMPNLQKRFGDVRLCTNRHSANVDNSGNRGFASDPWHYRLLGARSRKFGSICICTKFRNVQGRAFMECYS